MIYLIIILTIFSLLLIFSIIKDLYSGIKYKSNLQNRSNKLKIEILEDRSVPSIAFSDSSIGELSDGNAFIFPYGSDYIGSINSTVSETSTLGNYNYVAIPGPGGGPLLIQGNFNSSIQNRKFVFDDSFRGGVNLDENNSYIVVGAMAGGGPEVEVFDKNLDLISSFYAFDSSFRNGIDVKFDQDGNILVSAMAGGGPEVAKFNIEGQLLSANYVEDPSNHDGIQVMSFVENGQDQIVTLAGSDLRVFDQNFNLINSATLPEQNMSLGSAYATENLIDHIVVGDNLGFVYEYDMNPLFPGGRICSDVQFTNGPITLGITHEFVDGVDRFNLTNGLLSSDTIYSQDDLSGMPTLNGPISPTPGAYAIGPSDGGTGTLTGYVEDSNGQLYGLTNHHVVTDLNGNTFIGKQINEPGPAFPDQQPFGTVANWTPITDSNNVNDSAIIKVDTSQYNPQTAYIDPLETIKYVTPHGASNSIMSVGELVYKFGMWGAREGIVISNNATVRIQQENGSIVTYTGQYLIASADDGISFIIPGDSGSLVTDFNGQRTAQAFAGNAILGIASPIQTVLNSLNVSFLN